MIRTLDGDQSLWLQRGRKQARALRRGHDTVGSTGYDQNRTGHTRYEIYRRVSVPQQPPETHGHGSAQRFTQICQAARIDVRATSDVRARGSRITREPRLGRRARVASVPAIVEQERRKTAIGERLC